MTRRFAFLVFITLLGPVGASLLEAQELPPQCERLIPLGRNIIYKGCAGSGHLSRDPRGAGLALIAKRGTSLRPDACMRMYKLDGTKIAGLYLYPFNDPRVYAWRGYSNYITGCGRGDTRSKVRTRANGEQVFIQVKKRTKTCIRLSKVYQNINSQQGCSR